MTEFGDNHPMRPAARPRRVGIVEDHPAVIFGLRAMVADIPDIQIVATASTVADLLSQTRDLDLAVLDLQLPDGSSPYTNVEQLRAAGVEALVYTSGDHVFLVRAAARAGVLGVVLKSESELTIVSSIQLAAHGHLVPSTDWAAAIDSDPDLPTVDLSPRQRQVLELYASGEKAARVATLTGLSPETVNDYLGRIRQKYAEAGRAAPTKTDLFKRAVEDGYLPVPRRTR